MLKVGNVYIRLMKMIKTWLDSVKQRTIRDFCFAPSSVEEAWVFGGGRVGSCFSKADGSAKGYRRRLLAGCTFLPPKPDQKGRVQQIRSSQVIVPAQWGCKLPS